MRIIDKYKKSGNWELFSDTSTSFHMFLVEPQELHPFYRHNSRNPGPVLQQLVAQSPPAGGMAAYIADMDGAGFPVSDTTRDAA